MQEELYIAFENYLNNEMTLEQKNAFENQLQNDEDFKKQFELYKETNSFLEVKFSKETSDFKENLKSISENHFANSTKKKSKVISLQSKWFAIAAMLVVFIGVWYLNQGTNPSYSDYNFHNEAHFVERSEGNPDLKAAQDYFNAKDYQKSSESFAKIDNLTNPEVQLFYAISLIETDKYSKAKILLENVSQGNSVYKEEAIWYLALSSLKQRKYDESKKYLKQITEDSEKYSSAQKLLNDLE
ncbi:tol-pal system YbgF family protein [Flavobacterium ponti]|uniref:Tol-pal system YbgF family protein n=1 Tax=Flavobacterium ponti TaxID=665133 RepID=A0ABV9NZ79_9FLAO